MSLDLVNKLHDLLFPGHAKRYREGLVIRQKMVERMNELVAQREQWRARWECPPDSPIPQSGRTTRMVLRVLHDVCSNEGHVLVVLANRSHADMVRRLTLDAGKSLGIPERILSRAEFRSIHDRLEGKHYNVKHTDHYARAF
jgi:hypothetical protein